eukprot:2186070-Pyramimonas_sp.AAC.1
MRLQPLGPSVERPMGPRSAVLVPARGTACECSHLGHRWISLWGHEALYWAGVPFAIAATGAFGGATYGATKRCIGRGRPMRVQQPGLLME